MLYISIPTLEIIKMVLQFTVILMVCTGRQVQNIYKYWYAQLIPNICKIKYFYEILTAFNKFKY